MRFEHHSCTLGRVVYPEATLQNSRRTRNWPNGSDLVTNRHSSVTRNPTFEGASCFDLVHEFLPSWRPVKRNLIFGGEETAKCIGLVAGQDSSTISEKAGRFLEMLCHLSLCRKRHYSQPLCNHLNT